MWQIIYAIHAMNPNMIIRAISPLRMSFAGGGTDIAEYWRDHGGAVINSTINWYAHTHLSPTHDQLRVISLDYGTDTKIEHFGYDGKNDLIKATFNRIARGKHKGGAEFLIHTDAPPGSGLGASSAVIVSLIGAINLWINRTMDNYEVAEVAYDIERNDLGIRGGYQDQFATTFGGFNYIEFLRDGKVIVHPLRIEKDNINELESHLLLCYTGSTRLSARIIEKQVDTLAEGINIAALHEQKKIAIEMKNAILKGSFDDFGHLLDEAWQGKKTLAKAITSSHIDRLYSAARNAGAVGGKILGAGGGGYLLLYCNYRKKHEVERLMRSMGATHMPFSFVKDGMKAWRSKNVI